MGKRIDLAISQSLTIALTSGQPESPPDVPHAALEESDASVPPDLRIVGDVKHASLAEEHETGLSTIDPGLFPDVKHAALDDIGLSDPLSMLTAGPDRGFDVKHASISIDLPESQNVSRVEVRRAENGDLILTLHE